MKIFYFHLVLLIILALGLTACGHQAGPASALAQEALAGDPAVGQALFTATCSACHGPMGEGLPGLGKNLVTSKFVVGQSDHDLVEFIKTGRGPDDPLNTTGVTMPPKGNNLTLSDEDLYHIVAYLRTIQK